MKYAALCCIAKDEDLFLKEWLVYHSLIGFEHFFVYDNNSARPIADLLDGFAGPDRVTILRSGVERSQPIAYGHCLANFGHEFKWIAFLDLDEFIRISPDNSSSGDVRELLAGYEPYAGLGLNWRMFSSSGHDARPGGLVIENYTSHYEDDLHIKSIIQPDKTAGCAGPHSFYPHPGHHAVNADHFPIPPGFPATLPAMREACVNHYYFKSRECFASKIAKGNPCNILRRMEQFDEHLALPAKSDTTLLAYANPVREALAADRLPLPQAPALAVSNAPGRDHDASAPEAAGGIADVAGGIPVVAGDTSPAPDAGDFLAAAREHFKKGRLPQAQLCLCYAVLHNEADAEKTSDPLISLEIWTLRASIARKRGRYDHAEFFLRQAFACGASVEAHSELAGVMLNTGRAEESRQLISLIRGFHTL